MVVEAAVGAAMATVVGMAPVGTPEAAMRAARPEVAEETAMAGAEGILMGAALVAARHLEAQEAVLVARVVGLEPREAALAAVVSEAAQVPVEASPVGLVAAME
jgi:hypothetical protein